jgi:hypothetical protein
MESGHELINQIFGLSTAKEVRVAKERASVTAKKAKAAAKKAKAAAKQEGVVVITRRKW